MGSEVEEFDLIKFVDSNKKEKQMMLEELPILNLKELHNSTRK